MLRESIISSINKNFCPSQCTGTCVISYDNNSFVNKVYSNISPDFYNNTYIYSQQNISEDFWSLSNTPVAKGSNTYDVKFLEETNDPFNGNLYSQYVFNLATPENIQNGTVLCSGSCFSNIDNKIYSNSLLIFITHSYPRNSFKKHCCFCATCYLKNIPITQLI